MPNRFWGTTAAPKGVAFVARTEVPDTTVGSIGRSAALVGRQHWSVGSIGRPAALVRYQKLPRNCDSVAQAEKC